MKKKFIVLFLTLIMSISIVSCNNKDDNKVSAISMNESEIPVKVEELRLSMTPRAEDNNKMIYGDYTLTNNSDYTVDKYFVKAIRKDTNTDFGFRVYEKLDKEEKSKPASVLLATNLENLNYEILEYDYTVIDKDGNNYEINYNIKNNEYDLIKK